MTDRLKGEGIFSMGYGSIPKMIMQDKSLSIEAKSIYAYFASYAGSGNTAYPSVGKTIHDLNVSEERYYKYRKQLINKGYLVITKVKTKEGKYKKNLYTLPTFPKNSDMEKPSTENPSMDKQCMEKECKVNLGINRNSINNNSKNNNNIDIENDEDDDMKSELEKTITPKIIKNLENAGITNITETKLLPVARSMSKLMFTKNRTQNEAEEIILLAIEVYELNNGHSMQYLIKLLTDWYDNDIHTAESVREYIAAYRENGSGYTNVESNPVPMINWLKNSENNF